ncbi:MAG: PilN domain-containing protein [Planctomycetales bacterium]|nr:PilN domain-containing protein [Planctomycetales bacterium]
MSNRINLMPAKLLRAVEHRRNANKWLPVWVGVTLLLGLGQFGLQQSLNQAAYTREQLARRAQPLREVQAQVTKAEADAGVLRDKLQRLSALEQADAPLALLQVVVEACREGGHQVSLNSYEMSEQTVAPTPATGKPGLAAPQKLLSLQGIAASDDDVSRLVQELRSRNLFKQVHLEATQSTGDPDSPSRAFRLLCER